MHWIGDVVHWIGIVIELMAVTIIAWASLETFVRVSMLAFRRASDEERRDLYLRYLRSLVIALTFQLAADLVHVALATTWEKLGHVAVIAVIRTFLAYFLDRDKREASQISKG